MADRYGQISADVSIQRVKRRFPINDGKWRRGWQAFREREQGMVFLSRFRYPVEISEKRNERRPPRKEQARENKHLLSGQALFGQCCIEMTFGSIFRMDCN